MHDSLIPTLLPLVVVAAVFALRYRNLSKPVRFRPERLWIAPAIAVLAVGAMLSMLPPHGLGWLALLLGVMLGGGFGWQRARLMRLERDPASGALMMRQSPAALLLLVGLFAVKRLAGFASGADPAGAGGTALSPQAMMITDALLGLGVAMVVAMRTELWRRAKGFDAAL